MIKAIRVGVILATIIWLVNGLITIGSIYLSINDWHINLIVGIIFMSIGLFIYWKERNLIRFIKQNQVNTQLSKKVITGECILVAVSFIIGSVIMGAIISRVFLEGFAVFG